MKRLLVVLAVALVALSLHSCAGGSDNEDYKHKTGTHTKDSAQKKEKAAVLSDTVMYTITPQKFAVTKLTKETLPKDDDPIVKKDPHFQEWSFTVVFYADSTPASRIEFTVGKNDAYEGHEGGIDSPLVANLFNKKAFQRYYDNLKEFDAADYVLSVHKKNGKYELIRVVTKDKFLQDKTMILGRTFWEHGYPTTDFDVE